MKKNSSNQPNEADTTTKLIGKLKDVKKDEKPNNFSNYKQTVHLLSNFLLLIYQFRSHFHSYTHYIPIIDNPTTTNNNSIHIKKKIKLIKV